jgi:HlyD family type I secretion membrane fusion protein
MTLLDTTRRRARQAIADAAAHPRLAPARAWSRRATERITAPRAVAGELDLDLRPPIMAGVGLMAVGFLGFTIWAATAPLHSAVLAPGYVAVESQRKVIQHLEGGIVDAVLVVDGATVAAGDLLVRLDARQAQARQNQFTVRLLTLGAEKARLEAELAEADDLALDPALRALAGDPRLQRAISLQATQMRTARADRGHRTAALETRLAQTVEEINGLQAQLAGREQRLALMRERLAGLRQLAAAGHTSRVQMSTVEGEHAALEGEHGDLVARIAGARQKHGQVAEELGSLDRGWRTQAAERLQAIERDYAEARESLAAAEDVMRRTEIRAPTAGTVQQLAVHTRGAVIRAGETLLQIVPQEDVLVVEAQVRPEDIEAIHRGLEVQVRLSALNARRTPPVAGTLSDVSADRIVDPRTGLARYSVKARFDPGSLARLGSTALKPGMPADVMIMRQERTFLDYLLDPVLRAAERAFRER